ncbi:iron ABC transporter substrate-binding protein [Mycolicibacterium novocastrense]|uniref:ABC transporter substrate-binding protein n=1 Tax=Mycolicibacterium novocastrense TaxID=59813 RepID=UPI000749351E|nr:ABC transporter substrate-binding protein [Mycolicibacterium novocastrense]KUH70956.1 iron ABC transporter substrate-binding protein [Mycolicibacterium novocastrense]KUH72782.1 iron ABC transporter substrate-binding protein [Mycolicibacterium novocastrense]KUH76961.1 iron ABC transporter substrate-binding protein [Mycolicibacterium novocastrense]
MAKGLTRRGFLTASAGAALATAGFAAGCGSDKPGTVAKDGSVTVKHAFGETKIPAPPTRVVSAGLTGQDDLLALGVVPVAVTEWFGGEPFAVWPWARPKLGSAQPAVLSLAEGVQVDQIAALNPDLIVATNAGLDSDTYSRLSEIAPTVAQSGADAFFEPWKQQATTIGQAVFKHDEMQALIVTVGDRFIAVAESNPGFAGRTAALLHGHLSGGEPRALAPAWRAEFLTAMGLNVTDGLDADVLIWATESDEEQAALLADPKIAERGPANIFTGKELAGAIAFASPLSYPLVADQLPPRIAQALA